MPSTLSVKSLLDWGECSEDWAGAWRWGCGGGGGRRWNFELKTKFPLRNVPVVLKRKKIYINNTSMFQFQFSVVYLLLLPILRIWLSN